MVSVFRVLAILALFALGPRLPCHPALVSVASAQESARVWVNTRSGVYHCPGSQYYGKTKSGEFMGEAEARASGKRRRTVGPVAAERLAPGGPELKES